MKERCFGFLTFFINQINSGVDAFGYVLENIRLFLFNLILLVVDYIQDFRFWVNGDNEDSIGVLMF